MYQERQGTEAAVSFVIFRTVGNIPTNLLHYTRRPTKVFPFFSTFPHPPLPIAPRVTWTAVQKAFAAHVKAVWPEYNHLDAHPFE